MISFQIQSIFLGRVLSVDIYTTQVGEKDGTYDLLLFNDGQDLYKMNFSAILQQFGNLTQNLICVGIHAGDDRRQEYGVSDMPDYLNRGSKAKAYSNFILEELLPALLQYLSLSGFRNKYVAGFSLGGLMAFDITIEHPYEFQKCGVFSGSFWWRSKALGNGYSDEVDRIMHAKVRTKMYSARQQFFFQVGGLDEKADRNNNGIIDAIDDTLDLISELEHIGYKRDRDIVYLELSDGTHDIGTWGRAMPTFINWILS